MDQVISPPLAIITLSTKVSFIQLISSANILFPSSIQYYKTEWGFRVNKTISRSTDRAWNVLLWNWTSNAKFLFCFDEMKRTLRRNSYLYVLGCNHVNRVTWPDYCYFLEVPERKYRQMRIDKKGDCLWWKLRIYNICILNEWDQIIYYL